MLRHLVLLALAAAAQGALLTDDLGTTKRGAVETPKLEDADVWREYGLSEAETAKYEGAHKFTATAWRMNDPTGAQAAFRWLRPTESKPGNADALYYSKFAAQWKDTVLMTHGNYLLRFEGGMPSLDELKIFLFQLPKLDQSSLPPVLEYVPKDGLITGSDRFINGPASLAKFYSKLSPSAVGFHFGPEAIVARYNGSAGPVEMAVFYYPSNPMARERQAEFQKVNGAVVKRSGPLLAIVAGAGNADDAQRVLSLVNYKAQVTIDQPKPGTTVENAGDLILAIVQLSGVLILLAIGAGIMVFLMRSLRRKASGGQEDEPMTMLHLEDRR
ncbi:MAG: hypothetical protein JST93_03615 [Acidobacteria bacterium]|nr:hypothetical protein [Acidobacteriota bacterium]